MYFLPDMSKCLRLLYKFKLGYDFDKDNAYRIILAHIICATKRFFLYYLGNYICHFFIRALG